ncbi:hypothetical protein R8Z50_03430 [Longispora sp. K20-0274]|uniref:hypothetical protein n=1 Tax=Longispora sp. K20-0274 TaxID=3088255 RepID=UPI00399A46E2
MRTTRLAIVVLGLGLLTVPGTSLADPAPAREYGLGYSSTETSAIAMRRPEDTTYSPVVLSAANDSDAAWNSATDSSVWIRDGAVWYRGAADPVRLTHGRHRHPTLSPDGGTVVYEQAGELRLIRVDGTGDAPLTRGVDPSWTPDGTRVLFSVDGDVHTVRRDGTDNRRLGPGTQPAASPDGTRIAFTSGPDVLVMPSTGGSGTRLLPASWGDSAEPAWSQDGTLIAFVTRKDDHRGDVYTVDVATRATHVLSARPGAAESRPSWRLASWDGRAGQPTVVFAQQTGSATTDVWTADPPTDLTNRPDNREQDPAYSPDGTRLAYTEWRADPNGDPQSRIVVADANGADPHELTAYRTGVTATEPAWSPDGTMIAYVEARVPDTVRGLRNIVSDGTDYVAGYSNVLTGPGRYAFASGSGNRLHTTTGEGSNDVYGDENYTHGLNRIHGFQNAVHGRANELGRDVHFVHGNEVVGDGNIVDGDRNAVTGGTNRVTGNGNTVIGNGNTVSGNGNRVVGDNLTVGGNGELDPAGQIRIARVADRVVIGAVPMPRHTLGSDRSPAWSPDGTRLAVSRTATPYLVDPVPEKPPVVNLRAAEDPGDPGPGGPWNPQPPAPVYPAGVFPDRVDRHVRPAVPFTESTAVRGQDTASHVTPTMVRCDPGLSVALPGPAEVPKNGTVWLQPKITATASGGCVVDYRFDDGARFRQVFRVTVAPGPTVNADDAFAKGDRTGGAVPFKAWATDADGNSLTVRCSQNSGTKFPVGVTRVTCTATDRDGRTATDTADITVYKPGSTGTADIWLATLNVTTDQVTVTDQTDLSSRIADGSPCGLTGSHGAPAWSPDGRSVAFIASSSRADLCVVGPDGGPGRSAVRRGPRLMNDPAWSPDGQWIAFTGAEDPGGDIPVTSTTPAILYTVPAGGGTPTAVVTSPGEAVQAAYHRVPDLRVTLTAAPATIPFLGGTTLTFTVTNEGGAPAPATEAVFSAPGLRITALRPARGGCDVPAARCSLGTVAPGETVAVTVTAQGTAQGPHHPTGTATSALPDGRPDDNSATAEVTVGEPFRDLAVSASAAPTPGYVGGDPIVVTFTVVNGSQIPLRDVRLTTTLPAALLPATAVSPANCAATGCALGDLPAGGSVEVRVTVPPKIALEGTATGTVTSATTDPDPTNNTARAPIVVRQPALVVNPGDLPGRVALARGTNFPPGAQVRLPWSAGINRTPATATVDANGNFTAQVLVFTNDALGGRALRAEPAAGVPFGPVTAPFLVEPRAEQPPLR